MGASINFDKITMGVCYYPEHWQKEMWQPDLKRMKEYGIEVIRIAEFAWNKFEPEDGLFTFDFWDSFMDVAAAEDMKVIFCTPTATPPIWLTEKYPEVLNADIDGNLLYHGIRRHYNMNSKVYRQYSARITEKLAEHYVGNKQIIGWQLDNEINCEIDKYYSKSDHEAFREYCKNKYKTLDAFNEAMGTIVWNQTYTDWNQVHLARRTTTLGNTNPHLQLEEARFISETVIGYFKLQADIIRKWQKTLGVEGQFITTNGMFRYVDYQKLVGEVLDFFCYDNYPAFAFESIVEPEKTNGFKDRNTSFNLTKVRSISSNYGIMEQQSGAGGWNCRMKMPMPKPGQMRLWTMQSIAHGADFVSFFRWRTARVGTEIYWHGLLDYDNRDNRRMAELSQIKEDISNLKELAGAKVKKQVALLMDYDNEWDGFSDIWHGPLDQISYDAWFRALEENHVPFDFKYINDETKVDELSDYSLLVYPHATIFSQKRHDMLEAYIREGGKVIFGARSGYKDEQGHCLSIPMPGLLADLCGCYVKEYTADSPYEAPTMILINGKKAQAKEFYDILEPTDGEIVGHFSDESSAKAHYYSGEPAVVKKANGKGFGYYVGGAFSKELAELLLEETKESQSTELVSLEKSLELVIREKDGHSYLFVLNYDSAPAQIKVNKELFDMINSRSLIGDVEIAGYGFLILRD